MIKNDYLFAFKKTLLNMLIGAFLVATIMSCGGKETKQALPELKSVAVKNHDSQHVCRQWC